jgi:hypothetical protein
MSFIKAFGFSILAFIGLNVVFFLIAYAVDGTLDVYFQSLTSTPTNIFYMLLGPIYGLAFPSLILTQFSNYVSGAPFDAATLILMIGYIVSPVVAAILSGVFGEDKTQSFLGWFTTAIISSIIFIIAMVIDMVMAGVTVPIEYVFATLMIIVGIGVIYGLLYGSIALLMPD